MSSEKWKWTAIQFKGHLYYKFVCSRSHLQTYLDFRHVKFWWINSFRNIIVCIWLQSCRRINECLILITRIVFRIGKCRLPVKLMSSLHEQVIYDMADNIPLITNNCRILIKDHVFMPSFILFNQNPHLYKCYPTEQLSLITLYFHWNRI